MFFHLSDTCHHMLGEEGADGGAGVHKRGELQASGAHRSWTHSPSLPAGTERSEQGHPLGGHRSQVPRDIIGLPFLLEVTVTNAGWEAVDFLQSPGVGRTTLGGGKKKKKTSVNFIGIIFRKG